MSVTPTQAKTAKKSRQPAKAAAIQALTAVLAQSPVELVPYSRLVKTPLNARFIPYSQESLNDLADSIAAVGLLQNLVVVELPDGSLGVAAGGRRTAALGVLVQRGVIKPDQHFVSVKKIPVELAVAASMVENGKRKDMHPAEQIVGFRSLAQEGKTAAQIGDLLGYGSRHVQRCLKLAGLAPVLLEALAKDDITLDQCQVLALEDNQERQEQVWEQAR